jgi:hypothetical protein
MENQREKLRRDGMSREISREAHICGKDDQKPSVMAMPPHNREPPSPSVTSLESTLNVGRYRASESFSSCHTFIYWAGEGRSLLSSRCVKAAPLGPFLLHPADVLDFLARGSQTYDSPVIAMVWSRATVCGSDGWSDSEMSVGRPRRTVMYIL